MHSWVFRNRDRLRWIYGQLVEGPQEPGPPRESGAEEERAGELEPALATGMAGRVEREDDDEVVVYPMPRRAS